MAKKLDKATAAEFPKKDEVSESARDKAVHVQRETTAFLNREALDLKLYGRKVPEWAEHVLRCVFCNRFISFSQEYPSHHERLGNLECEGCKAVQPVVEKGRRYDPRVVRTLDADRKEFATQH